MRRKATGLVPFEVSICVAAAALLREGAQEFHGYALAQRLAIAEDQRRLVGYGTLYRALGRLDAMGYLTSRWETDEEVADDRRPRRRLYALTDQGTAVARHTGAKARPSWVPRFRRREVPA